MKAKVVSGFLFPKDLQHMHHRVVIAVLVAVKHAVSKRLPNRTTALVCTGLIPISNEAEEETSTIKKTKKDVHRARPAGA